MRICRRQRLVDDIACTRAGRCVALTISSCERAGSSSCSRGNDVIGHGDETFLAGETTWAILVFIYFGGQCHTTNATGLVLEEVIPLISIISFHCLVLYDIFTSLYILIFLYSVTTIIYDLSHTSLCSVWFYIGPDIVL